MKTVTLSILISMLLLHLSAQASEYPPAQIVKVTIAFIDPGNSTHIRLSPNDVVEASEKHSIIASRIEVEGDQALFEINQVFKSPLKSYKIQKTTRDTLDARIVFRLILKNGDSLQITFQTPTDSEWNNVDLSQPSPEIMQALLKLLPQVLFQSLAQWEQA